MKSDRAEVPGPGARRRGFDVITDRMRGRDSGNPSENTNNEFVRIEGQSAVSTGNDSCGLSPLSTFENSYFSPLQLNNSQPEPGFPSPHYQLSTSNLQHRGFTRDAWNSNTSSAYCPQSQGHVDYQNSGEFMDPNLLSADNYREPEPPTGSAAQNTVRVGMYGVVLENNEGDTMSSRPTVSSRGNMRNRRGLKKDTSKSSGVDETSRQRGRPRIDAQDVTSAERRRTQIRLAQRAYRQRKETTIAGLNNRVATLECVIEDMNRAFVAFNHKATASRSLDPSLRDALKHTTNRFAELAKSGAPQSFEAEDAEQEPVTPPSCSAQSAGYPQHSNESPPGQDNASGATATSASMAPKPISAWGYQTTYEETTAEDDGEITHFDESQRPGIPLSGWDATEPMQDSQIEVSQRHTPAAPKSVAYFETNEPSMPQGYSPETPFDEERQALDNIPPRQRREEFSDLQQYRIQIPDINFTTPDSITALGKELPLPETYSYQETSFARRLIRSAYEAGQRLMTDPNANPDDLKRLCRYSYCFTNRSGIRQMMNSVTNRSATENLEVWKSPLYHVGGAGLHFPRDSIDASSPAPPWWSSSGPLGPFNYPLALTPAYPNVQMLRVPDLAGIEGEWFDSNDVEQYLRTKGLYIDAMSSVVEIKEPDEGVLPEMSPDSAKSWNEIFSNPQSPRNLEAFAASDSTMQHNTEMWNENLTNFTQSADMNMDFTYDDSVFPNPKAYDAEFDVTTLGYYDGLLPAFKAKPKKLFFVQTFLDAITQTSTCLGRTLGFRKAAVDSAMKLATNEILQDGSGPGDGFGLL